MTRRVLAFVLALTLGSGAQGTLMYGAAATAEGEANTQVVEALAMSDGAAQCLRGAGACFGYGSWDCCTEIAVLGVIAAAVGHWVATGVALYYYWYSC